jgi:hypothetical protein
MTARPKTEAELSPVDREALELAIEHDLTLSGAATRQQIEAKLREEPWLEVAMFCAYGQQCANLKLEPWQPPPCWAEIDDDDGNDGPIMGAPSCGLAVAANAIARNFALASRSAERDCRS